MFTRQGAGVLFKCGNSILLGKRKFNPFKNYWATPGGMKDKHDASLKHTAFREAFEEIGFPTENLKKAELKSSYKIELPFFEYTIFVVELPKKPKSIRIKSEFSDLAWFNKDNLPRHIHFGIKKVLEQFA